MSESILSVNQSLNQSRWVFPDVDENEVAQIVQKHDLPDFIARFLQQRGVEIDTVRAFLYPTLKDDFPDPFSMEGMRAFADDMAMRIDRKDAFGVFADFDVDGATSAAILIRFFRHFGLEVPVYIPDRLKEGYGPSPEALKTLKEQGAQFIVMADCGTTAFDALKAGKEMGLEIAVFDHHEAEEQLPEAAHVINPKRKDDESGLDMLAACGVTFLACVAINNALRDNGYYEKNNIKEAPLKSWLDLVALGTVCDMVPLQGVNRLLVRSGFQQMAAMNNNGIKALCSVANLETAPQASHAGFTLGPRINAGSRVHKSDQGAKLLSTDDPEEAMSIAWALDECNEQRKKIQSDMNKEAQKMVEARELSDDPIIMVGHENWHPGLSGLVAGRLKDKYKKPAVVVTYAENQDGILEGRGSGRSVPGISMADAFIDARNEGLLVKGGGHAMAGGFTVLPEQVAALHDFLKAHVQKQMEDVESVYEVFIDSIATVRGARVGMIRLLEEQVGPFGVGNPEPLFALANVRIHLVDVLKDKHIRVQFSDWEGGTRMKAMLFNGVGTALGDALLKNYQQPFHLVGQFKINDWQGRQSVEFHISDGALVMADASNPEQQQTQFA